MIPVHLERFEPLGRGDETMPSETLVERIDRLHQPVVPVAVVRIEQIGLNPAFRANIR